MKLVAKTLGELRTELEGWKDCVNSATNEMAWKAAKAHVRYLRQQITLKEKDQTAK